MDPRMATSADPRLAAAGVDPRLIRGTSQTIATPDPRMANMVDPRLVGGDPRLAQASKQPPGAHSTVSNDQHQPAKRARVALSKVLRLSSAVGKWFEILQKSCDKLDPTKEMALVSQCGVTITDLTFELEMLRELKRKFESMMEFSSAEIKQVNANFMALIKACPVQLLREPRPMADIDADHKIANVTEVVREFAWLGAGGPENEKDKIEKRGGICVHGDPSEESVRERAEVLRKWYASKNVCYILNLASAEPDMKNATYAIPHGKRLVTIEPDSSELSDTEESAALQHDIVDDPDDDQLRVMYLPMVDDVDVLNVKLSWEMREAAKFLERAWRRHQRVLYDRCKRRLTHGSIPDEGEALPTIIVHCIGGINRSPLCVIYWLVLRHTALEVGMKQVDWWVDHVWDIVCRKRRVCFQKESNPVLENKEEWKQGLKERVWRDKDPFKQHNMLPFMGFAAEFNLFRNALKLKAARLCAFEADCGGLSGSPIMSDDEEWI